MKTVLVPVDLSNATAPVCNAAIALARLSHARLVLMHVVQSPPFVMSDYYGVDVSTMSEIVAAGEKAAARKMEILGRRYARKGTRGQTTQTFGQPVATILAQAAACKAAYIVMGSHGHGAVDDLLVGSTTHGVLHKARCPVLIVPIALR